MPYEIVERPIAKTKIAELAKDSFGKLVKAVVDVERRIMMIGGELHADAEALLLENGSKQQDLWGINLYPDKPFAEWLEFDSMINLRPSQGNLSRGVDDPHIREQIVEIVKALIQIL